jgi:hypothetical protein
MECIYELMTFGIPVDDYPISSDMVLNRKKHLEWVQARRFLEVSASSSTDNSARCGVPAVMVLVPKSTDILFGRGRSIREHPGNLRFVLLVESYMDRYEGLELRNEKTVFTQEAVFKIKSMGGRFLKQEAGVFWQEVDDELARDKVSYTLRSRRSTKKAEERKKEEEKANEHKKRFRQK